MWGLFSTMISAGFPRECKALDYHPDLVHDAVHSSWDPGSVIESLDLDTIFCRDLLQSRVCVSLTEARVTSPRAHVAYTL